MKKIHRFFGLELLAALSLLLLAGGIGYYNIQEQNVRNLTQQSIELLAEWNRIQNLSHQLLLDRYTVSSSEIPPRFDSWKNDYKSFSSSLETWWQNPSMLKLEGIPDKMERIQRVWRYTEVQLNNADHFFRDILKTGLGEKVMINGFLHTMYKLRMSRQLTVSEIFLLDNTLNALDTLDIVSGDFDTLFTSVIDDLKRAGEDYLKKVRLAAAGFVLSVLLILGLLAVVEFQLRASLKNRKLYLESQKDILLRKVVENSCEENLELFAKRRKGLQIDLELKLPLLPLAVQIDDYAGFSHQYNILEQEEMKQKIRRAVAFYFTNHGLVFESFRYQEDMLYFLANCPFDFELALSRFLEDESLIRAEVPVSVSFTLGGIITDPIDLDRDMEALCELMSYRFVVGNGQVIYPGSTSLVTDKDFKYPLDKETRVEEALRSLDEEKALKKLNEMIDFGIGFGPRNLRRLILRLTACLSATVEFLEKTYRLDSAENLTPMMLRVQTPETLEEVRNILEQICIKIIRECSEQKEGRVDQMVEQIKSIIQVKLHDYNLSVDSIADEVQLSAAYINRLFKQHTALSIAGYINKKRLEQARKLLGSSEKTVAEAAEESGFARMGTFFRQFKKCYGRTPGDYQKEVVSSASSD